MIEKIVKHSNRCGGDPCCTGSCMEETSTFTSSGGRTVVIPYWVIEDFVDLYEAIIENHNET